MSEKESIRKPALARGCETCEFRNGDFWKDSIDPKITRLYCRARHVNVDAETMSKDCDFWKLSSTYEKPVENNRYGLQEDTWERKKDSNEGFEFSKTSGGDILV